MLVRGDTGSGVQPLLWHVHNLGLAYSVGVYGRQPVLDALGVLPKQAWRAALDADGTARDGAQVAELTRWLPTTFVGWPPGMRIIARRERPHPGAQLRITDHQGWRITLFATNTGGGRLADLEARHRLRARAEDRIRQLKDTGLTNLPLQAFAKNQIWLELACPAYELLTWTQTLAFVDEQARRWEPKRLRLRLFAVAARIITTGRRIPCASPGDGPGPISSPAATNASQRSPDTDPPAPTTQDLENRRTSAGNHSRPPIPNMTTSPTAPHGLTRERSRLGDVCGSKRAMDSHAEVRATHRRNGLRWSAHFDLRCSLAPKDV